MTNIYSNPIELLNKLDLKSKKALLKLKTLQDPFADIITYRVIDNYIFNETIENIDDLSFFYDINVEKEKIKASNYIDLLDYFIKMIRHYFPNIRIDEFLIEDITKPNMNKMKEYLQSNTEIFDTTLPNKKKKNLNTLIYRILISNFISNIKYLPEISIFLEANDIQVKVIDNYSDKECKSIIDLMSDITFCQHGYNKTDYLFVNIEQKLNERIKTRHRKNRLNSIDADDYYSKKKIEEYNKEFHQSIRTYNNRKKYLKYFK